MKLHGHTSVLIGSAIAIGVLSPSSLTGQVDSRAAELAAARGGSPGRVIVMCLRTALTLPSCQLAALDSAVFLASNSVSAYFNENSYGRVTLTGDVAGPFTISLGEQCDRVGWADAADAVATAAGLDVAAYTYRVYIEPPETAILCVNEGSSQRALGSPRRSSWVRGDHWDSRLVIAHELGHNVFGSPHASSPTAVYGDGSTVMGLAPVLNPLIPGNWQDTPHFNAPEKIQMGWVPRANVESVTEDGNYRVALLEAGSTEIQVLRIQGSGMGYFFSYRRPVGFDASLLSWYANRTSIHLWNLEDEPYLLATIGDGQSFTDASGLSVTQTRHDATYAYLMISFSAAMPTAPSR